MTSPSSLTYSLSDRIHIVGDFEVRQDFLDLTGEVLRSEAHGIDVVGAADERVGRSLQELQSGPDAVIWAGEADRGGSEWK